jgi:carbonic anhydrase
MSILANDLYLRQLRSREALMNVRSILWVALGLVAPSFAVAQTHWGYDGDAAPQNWAKLDPKFAMCGLGRNQSPIDIGGFVDAQLKPLKLSYATHAHEIANHGDVAPGGATGILNNGHTVQVNYAPGSTLGVDGLTFELKQFHFHSPSENKIDGKQFPLEGHLVHADKEGNLAVVAVMFKEGPPNKLLAKLWEKMPANEGVKNALASGLNVSQLLPASKDYYRYNGSLTTPPCSEGVRWFVMKNAVTASKAQIDLFVKAVGHPNNRPLNPVNARAVLR